ncbi:16S rRNA (cytidine(1402)-2'-O)-methyltransferase [Nitratireductor indicus]|uniref:16S rRNA (cytidine(1402)-2'-O)-methyltransferase n=1 Tax=Nitratireductor indicus TaxID=721133 RepID=UPI00287607C7|nr:16S rRNA (cytidine(1402)-2'-O)-methyltransferase [Nitratireductor indicus]MDS1137336.1 16S rRNA (cytidine(1402)-2'-O)-methyltransferase [Nitratireductor indicus]
MENRRAENQRVEKSFTVGAARIGAGPLETALYLVATPIGNLADITLRALEVLAAADLLACEDTRVSRVLLNRYGINRGLTAYHEHNAREAGPRLMAALAEGKSVALISDAGTPLVSDPGYRLVEQAVEKGIRVVAIPGPSAVLAALSASGLPTDAFLFAGFLPVKDGQRRKRLDTFRQTPASLIFFESPRRLADSLAAMAEVLGDNRPACVAREITKTFEEMRRGTLATLAAHYAEAGAPKGEIVVCIAPPQEEEITASGADTDRLLVSLASEMPASKAAGEAARMTGGRKSELYQRLLALKAQGDGD